MNVQHTHASGFDHMRVMLKTITGVCEAHRSTGNQSKALEVIRGMAQLTLAQTAKVKRPSEKWTAKQIATLRRMRKAKATQDAIAYATGKTTGAVAGQIKRLGLPLTMPTRSHNSPRPRGNGGQP
jgi:hypothetical protein